MTAGKSRTARIRALAHEDEAAAPGLLADLMAQGFGLQARNPMINHDPYSLNSLNGFFSAGTGDLFFKFHQEDGEEAMRGEYCRAEILEHAGLLVDMPLYRSVDPGNQILIYRRRTNFGPSRVRATLLEAKAGECWRPMLAEMKRRDLLPSDWRQTLRAALLCCPTLVLNLRARASSYTLVSSLIAFAVSVMVSSAPESCTNQVTGILDFIAPV